MRGLTCPGPLAVTGMGSSIITALSGLISPIAVVRIGDEIPDASRYVLCAGVLRPKPLSGQTPDEVAESLEVNLIRPMRLCDEILARNDTARICVVGSESGYAWSYDGAYAAAKTALHRYVETKRLLPDQQLVCVAPSIIEDAGMTSRREDIENLERRRDRNPKKRFLRSIEVARMIYHLLYVDEGYTTGVMIRMNGGDHIR